MLLAILGLLAASFVISWVSTWLIRPVAVRIGFVDRPGGRKIHANAKPLGGGVAIFLGFAVPMAGVLMYVHTGFAAGGCGGDSAWRAYWSGALAADAAGVGDSGGDGGACICAGLWMHRRAAGAL